jgi:hypothetical protein
VTPSYKSKTTVNPTTPKNELKLEITIPIIFGVITVISFCIFYRYCKPPRRGNYDMEGTVQGENEVFINTNV